MQAKKDSTIIIVPATVWRYRAWYKRVKSKPVCTEIDTVVGFSVSAEGCNAELLYASCRE